MSTDAVSSKTDRAAALTVSGVSKSFGGVAALKGVSMEASPGERVALLGHNGAGKTTLMKIVLGLIAPSAGEVSILGAVAGGEEARSGLAYLPENVAFQKSLTGREQLTFFARLAGKPVSVVGGLLERVGLADAADRRIGAWSKGMRQRLGLAQVLLRNPRVALLDEPASGLDPVSRRELYAMIDELAADGCAVVISSHALTELEARTDRIAILRKGALVANDSVAALSARAGLPTRIRLTARTGAAEEVQSRIGGERVNGASIELHRSAEEKMTSLAHITALGDLIADVEIAPPNLEDLYQHYSKEDAP